MKVQLNLNTMVKKSGHCGKVGVRGVGLKSLDLVWTVLRKAEIELQFEHTVRFFFHLFKNFHRFLVTVVFGSSPTGAQSLFR